MSVSVQDIESFPRQSAQRDAFHASTSPEQSEFITSIRFFQRLFSAAPLRITNLSHSGEPVDRKGTKSHVV